MKPGAPMAAEKYHCDAKCQHVAPGSWPHETKLEEDRGEIHTDDCGFMTCTHDHDPGECCTAGEPGSFCRVFSGRIKKEVGADG